MTHDPAGQRKRPAEAGRSLRNCDRRAQTYVAESCVVPVGR
jgi:hypothetical protein